jgi:TonB family protein
VSAINFPGLSPELIQQVESRITIRTGDTLDADAFGRLGETLRQIDEHLGVSLNFVRRPGSEQTVNLNIALQQGRLERRIIGFAGGVAAPAQPYSGPAPVVVGAKIQGGLLIGKVPPPYPDLAKRTGIQGAVTYSVIIGADGTVQNLQLISGNPMLATEEVAGAVRQWRYRPYLLNGTPTPVQTEVTVNFVLN